MPIFRHFSHLRKKDEMPFLNGKTSHIDHVDLLRFSKGHKQQSFTHIQNKPYWCHRRPSPILPLLPAAAQIPAHLFEYDA